MSTPKHYACKEKYENKTFTICDEDVKVVKYVNSKNTIIQYEDKHLNSVEIHRLYDGDIIKNLMKPSVGKKGYIGIGKYSPLDEDGNDTRSYEVWSSLIRRCYTSKRDKDRGETVCDEWLNYQSFAEWYEFNYYEIDNIEVVLTNKLYDLEELVYSPDTTVFVPRFVNTFITQQKKVGGQGLPKGIFYEKRYSKNKYRVGFKKYNEVSTKYYGNYETLETAIEVLNQEKKKYVDEMAEMMIDKIPFKVYYALKNYKLG